MVAHSTRQWRQALGGGAKLALHPRRHARLTAARKWRSATPAKPAFGNSPCSTGCSICMRSARLYVTGLNTDSSAAIPPMEPRTMVERGHASPADVSGGA
eukprot:357189-Chlamydomonas_euryale.AAC.3